MTEPSLREEGDDGPPLAARVHNNQLLGNSNGEDSGGIDSEGDDKGGKGNGGRGYEDNGNDGRSFTAVLSRQPSSSCRPSSVVPPQPPTVTVIR